MLSSSLNRFHFFVLAVSLLATLGLDLVVPLGVAAGVVYVVPVMLAFIFFSDNTKITVGTTVGAISLLIAKYFWNLSQGVGFWVATINRSLSVFTIISVFTVLFLLYGRHISVTRFQYLRRFSIKKKFLTILLATLMIFMFSFAITSTFFQHAEDEWDKFDTNFVQPLNSIQKVREYIGFGCGIHAFKNYLLRGDSDYYARAEGCFKKALGTLSQSGFAKTFPEQTQDIHANINGYLQMLVKISDLRAQKMAIADIDRVVKMDDRRAVSALDDIERTLQDQIQAQNLGLKSSAKIRGALIFVVFMSTFILIFLIVSSLSSQFDSSVKQLVEAADKFASGHLEEKVKKQHDDELGDLAENLDVMRINLRANLISLENSNKDLEQFAYVASHDLQEPLRKIMAFGSRLEETEKTHLQGKSSEYLTKIMQSSARMRSLIDDLLSYSRVSTQKTDFERVDLNRILVEILDDLEVRIKESGAEILRDKLPVVRANAMQMRQLLQNLLSNALKFRKTDQSLKIEVRVQPIPGGRARINVKDNGIGFDKKYAEKIIQPFQRLHNRDEYIGTGIGLAICHKIVLKHGGSLLIDSKLGVGSDFGFDLQLDT